MVNANPLLVLALEAVERLLLLRYVVDAGACLISDELQLQIESNALGHLDDDG